MLEMKIHYEKFYQSASLAFMVGINFNSLDHIATFLFPPKNAKKNKIKNDRNLAPAQDHFKCYNSFGIDSLVYRPPMALCLFQFDGVTLWNL